MEIKELIELFKKETGKSETYEQAVKNELVFSGAYVLWLEDFAIKQVNGVKTNNEPALNLAGVMPRFFTNFMMWVYVNCYEQIDENSWKRWYDEEYKEACKNDYSGRWKMDTDVYTTEQLYEKCKNDVGYWESINGA